MTYSEKVKMECKAAMTIVEMMVGVPRAKEIAKKRDRIDMVSELSGVKFTPYFEMGIPFIKLHDMCLAFYYDAEGLSNLLSFCTGSSNTNANR